MLRRLFDKHKSPRNLPRKSTANESAVLKTRTGPAEPDNISSRALLKDVCVSTEAFRPMVARMENGAKRDPGQGIQASFGSESMRFDGVIFPARLPIARGSATWTAASTWD
jgi:hypothetical protein